MANLVIGFRLAGTPVIACPLTNELKLNQQQVFEIQLFPHQPATAILTHLKKNEIRSVGIVLPKELQKLSYEKMYVFLLQNDVKLVVSEEGYERLGNKKLVLRFTDSFSNHPIAIHILVQGKVNTKNFRIYLQPFAIEQSQAEVQESEGLDYLRVSFRFPELEGEKAKTIARILYKLAPNNLDVERSSSMISLALGPSLRQFISNPGLLFPLKKKASNEVEEIDSHFMEEHQEQEPPLSTTSSDSKEDLVKEIETLFQTITHSEYFHVFQDSIGSLPKSYLIDNETLDLMIKILQRFLLWFKEENAQKSQRGKRFKKDFSWIPKFHFLKRKSNYEQSET